MALDAQARLAPGGRRTPRGAFAIVLVHGAGANARRFDRLALLVPDAVAVDLPGHGGAPGTGLDHIEGAGGYAASLAALLRREGFDRPILVGHSMGAAVALAIALEGSVPLGGIGLIGAGPRLRVHPEFLARTARGEVPDGLAGLMYGPDADPALVAAEAEALVPMAASGVLGRDFAACDAFDASDRLRALDLPAALVVGSVDRMTPPRLGERLLGGWGDPGAIVATLVDGAGHYVQLERPEAVAGALLDLRARAAARTRHPNEAP